MRWSLCTALALTLLLQPFVAMGQSEEKTVRQTSLYADDKAHSVGDIVKIMIVERTSASNTSRLSTRKNSDFSAQAEEGTGLLSFLPDMGMSASFDRSHEGSGQLTREGRMTANISATVTEVQPNGNLVISGQHEVYINEEKELITVTGVVRPSDIRAGNVVFSSEIADAKINYSGKGITTKGSRPNIFVRILSWIF